MIGVKADTSKALQYLQLLEKKELPKVIGRSLNRTGNSVRSFVSTELRKRVNLKKAVLDQSLKVRRSNEVQTIAAFQLGRSWFEVVASGKPVPLRDYAANKVRVDGSRNTASYKVSKQGSRKRYYAKGQPGFIVGSLGGHVYVRTAPDPPGPQKAKIRKVFGPSVPQYFSTARLRKAAIEHGRVVWEKEIEANTRNAIRLRK